jgi:glyoxylase I family protein
MMVTQGHHYSFTVSDLEKSRRFYEDVLGFETIPRPDFGFPGVWYGVGPSEVHLIQKPNGAETGSPAPKLTPIANHSAFQIEDYDDAVAHLRTHGVEFLEFGREVGQIFLRDPDGNIIELIKPGGRVGKLPPDVAKRIREALS